MDAHFVETFKVVPMAEPENHTGTMTEEWVCVKNAHKATFLLYCGSIATGGAIQLGVADDASGTNSTYTPASMDLEMPHYWVSNAATAAASCDVFTKTTVTSSTFNVATGDDGKLFVIEVDTSKLGQFTSGSSTSVDATYISLKATLAGADFVSCVCILTGMRYQEDAPATVIA